MWKDLSSTWQQVYLQAWEAFQKGSIPIGAVIVDDDGNVLSVGRNHTREKIVPNPNTAHAENMCISNLDVSRYKDVKKYTLYTSLEPCPMCMGTIVMGNIRKLRVASSDNYCGALHYMETEPFIKSKNIDLVMEGGDMQDVTVALQCYYMIRAKGEAAEYFNDIFSKDSEKGARVGIEMYKTHYLDQCVENDVPFSEVYDYIVNMIAHC